MLDKTLKTMQVALGMSALALAATTAVSFASSPGRVAPPDPIAVEAAPSSDAPSFSNYRVIAERDLFRSRTPAPQSAPATPVIEESALEVELVGTLVAGKPEPGKAVKPRKRRATRKVRRAPIEMPGSLAILRDVDGSVRSLRLGDTFAEKSAKLVEIGRRRIVIEHAGKLEAVTLDIDIEGVGASATPRSTPPAKSDGTALGMLEGLFPGGSVEVAADVGVEAYRVSGASTTGALSLQEDDRVRAINGLSLGDPELDERIAEAIRAGSELRLTVEDASGRLRAVPLSRQSVEQALKKVH